MEDHSSADSSPKGLGGERDFPVQRLCGCLWRVEMIIYSCSLSPFFSSVFFVGPEFWVKCWVGIEWYGSIRGYNSIPTMILVSLWWILDASFVLRDSGVILEVFRRGPHIIVRFFLKRGRREWMEDYSCPPVSFWAFLIYDWLGCFSSFFFFLWLMGRVVRLTRGDVG